MLIGRIDEKPDQREKLLLEEAHDDSLYFNVKSVNTDEYTCCLDGTGGIPKFWHRGLATSTVEMLLLLVPDPTEIAMLPPDPDTDVPLPMSKAQLEPALTVPVLNDISHD